MNPSTRDTAFHLHLTRDTPLGRYCILPGDPGRVEGLAKALDRNALFIASHRFTGRPTGSTAPGPAPCWASR